MQLPDTSYWSGHRVLALAEQYEQEERLEECFELYRRVAHLVATTLPADRTAALIGRMMTAGAVTAAEQVFHEIVETCGPHPSSTAYTASALMSAGVPDLAYYFLDAVLAKYQSSEGELESLAAYLNAGRRSELAVYAFTAAARNKPVSTVLRYSAVLRKRGHSQSALDLLVSVVAGRPEDAGALVGALRKANREHEVEPVLSGLATGASDGACAVLLDCLVKDGSHADVEVLLDVLGRRPFASLASIASTVDAADAATMLVPALLAAPMAEQTAYFTSSQAELSSSQRGRLASLLVASAPEECPDALLSWYAGWADPSGLVWLVERLQEARIPLDPVLAAAAARRDFTTLREALHRLGAHQLSYRLAGLRSEFGL
ncbi:hypothetical protein KDL01_34330 [Actinospica durhamensis]|uniref:Uncharacterized protein n=1 Tax=Actinospica durhamensis TaxID=1508375 RepID=A0A941EUK4_9ACTN|nr:hypothetical protein [Actinospica durhamensis]MBR7838397.1 hypothetical protein [Actinospica durhamensis]